VIPTPGTCSEQATRWLHFVRPRPDLAGTAPQELLARTAGLAGNLRYGSPDGRSVIFVGEVRVAHAQAAADLSAALEAPVDTDVRPATGADCNEQVAEALEQAGLAGRPHEDGWVVPAAGRLPRALAVTPGAWGLRVDAVLIEWDEIGATQREALARLLCGAQLGLRFCRGELLPDKARLTALVEGRHLDGALADTLGGVAAGCRLLAQEAAALLAPDAARAYLDFVAGAQAKGGRGVSSGTRSQPS
jgi:hypothetical protein